MLSSVFLASLLSGLLLGVYAMLTGVERTPMAPRGTGSDAAEPARAAPPPPPAAHTRPGRPAVAASATLFGLVGYLLLRYTTVPPGLVIVLAAVAAGLGMVGMLTLVTRWAAPGASADHVDPRYLLQGTPARVTKAMDGTGDGEIEYAVDGALYATPARSFDGRALEVGADVAIDRVEDGVAYVEDWALVEERL